MGKIPPDRLLVVGKVIRPHGLGGLLRIDAQAGESFLEAGSVCLKLGPGETTDFEVESIKAHKKSFLMKLRGLDSIDEAEKYRGADILVARKALGPTEEDEYFWDELLGLEVFLDSGEYLGILSRILPTGANDIYVIRKEGREQMIPAIREVIREIDLDCGKMTVTVMEGLLGLNEV